MQKNERRGDAKEKAMFTRKIRQTVCKEKVIKGTEETGEGHCRRCL
jgi:hypothetical protein